jgi:CheY-like chemotaxis protein
MQSKPRVLYVEDEPMSRMVMSILLTKKLGLEDVTIFSDSSNFLERVKKLPQTPDVVFLDIHVPPYDGFQMLSMLRALPEYENVRVIALTASVMNEEVQELKEAGFDGGIAKPIDQSIFDTLLQRIMNGDEVWSIV